MKTMEFWLLRNKENGMYVYLDTHYTFNGCEFKLEQTDNIHHLTKFRDCHFYDIKKAEYIKNMIINRYKLDLEVVRFEQYTEYKEIKTCIYITRDKEYNHCTLGWDCCGFSNCENYKEEL
ncbi:MAG: hypothetical protein ACRCXT_24130 [Paraclostridium sp.]